MSLRLKFTLLFSFFVSVILLASIFVIYFLFTESRENEFNKRLWAQSVKIYQSVYNVKQLDKKTLKQVSKYYPGNVSDASTIIIDKNYRVVYSNNKDTSITFNQQLLNTIKLNKEYYFTRGLVECVGLYFAQQPCYVITSAYDKYGKGRLDRLKLIIFFVAAGGIILTGILAFFYVQQLIRPFIKLGEQMQLISDTNMKERVSLSSNKNSKELYNIAFQFNEMLDRFEKAFELQKSFVHHASHELRTPLATMLAQTEAALRREITVPQAKKVLESLKEDQQELIELTNSLLLLSQYERVNYSTAWPVVRLDEALYETISMTKKMFNDINVSLEFACIPETEDSLSVRGNDSLLKSAFRNLLKNAYLYSDDKNILVTIDADSSHIFIHFDNNGNILSQREQDNLFIPFFRGGNAQQKKGFGLGLSIVNRITTLHKGVIKYAVHNSNLNRFTIVFNEILA